MKTKFNLFRESKSGTLYLQVYLTNFKHLTTAEIYISPYNYDLTYKVHVIHKGSLVKRGYR